MDLQNILAVIFENESEGYQAMTQLRQLEPTENSTILQMVLVKNQDGRLSVCDSYDSGIDTTDDMLLGGLVGSLVGVLGGPVGVLLMGSYGMLAGSLLDDEDALDSAALIEKVAGKMVDGEVALIAMVNEENEAILDSQLSSFKAEVVRFDAAVVAEEVEEAQQMEKELARQAKAELRKAKKAERKEKIDQKREKLEADFEAFKAKFKKKDKESSQD